MPARPYPETTVPDLDDDVAALIGAQRARPGSTQQLDRLGARMSEAIARTDAHERHLRLPGGQSLRRQAVPAPVVRHFEHLYRHQRPKLGHPVLRGLLRIPRQDDVEVPRAAVQHDAGVVGVQLGSRALRRP